jgi:UDP-3-O-[3-hydroxymyristoyl] glucosamine N-acyltransferase
LNGSDVAAGAVGMSATARVISVASAAGNVLGSNSRTSPGSGEGVRVGYSVRVAYGVLVGYGVRVEYGAPVGYGVRVGRGVHVGSKVKAGRGVNVGRGSNIGITGTDVGSGVEV